VAHTDRDSLRIYWRDHWRSDDCSGYWSGYGCATCKHVPAHWRWWDWPPPSSWNREQRKAERNKLRQQVQKARNGRTDWDDMPSGEGKMYRRPYYW
jgi:hypothetical protein